MAAPVVKWGNIPLSFEPNAGQANAEVGYLARGAAYTLYLNNGETVLAAKNQLPLRTKLLGANPSARIVGEDQQSSLTNYFVGNDPSKWRSSIPNYGKARYRSLYPGIDLVYYGHHGSLEYDWVVSAGADPKRIRLTFDRADECESTNRATSSSCWAKMNIGTRNRSYIRTSQANASRSPAPGFCTAKKPAFASALMTGGNRL